MIGMCDGKKVQLNPIFFPVEQTYSQNSEAAQSGKAVAEAIAPLAKRIEDKADRSEIPTVEQVFNSNSENAQSGMAIAEYIGNQTYGYVDMDTLTDYVNQHIDQTYDGTSENAQSGVAIQNELIKNYATTQDFGMLSNELENKIDKVEGKGLSTDDFVKGDYFTKGESADFFITNETVLNKLEGQSESAFIPTIHLAREIAKEEAQDKVDNIEIPTVDQTFDGTSKNAQSGIAISNELSDYVDYNTYFDNNNGIASAIETKVDKVEGKGLSTNDFTDAHKTHLENLVVDTSYQPGSNEKSSQPQSGIAVSGAIEHAIRSKADKSEIPTVDQTFDGTSQNAQSGIAIHTGVVEPLVTELNGKVDKTSLIAGIDLQDNITAEELGEALSIPIVELSYRSNSSNAQSGKAVADALSTTLLKRDLLSKISEEKVDQKCPINSNAVIDYVSANYYNKTEIDTNKQDKATLNDNTVIIDNILALEDNAEYRMTDINTLTLTYPNDNFECWLRISFAETGDITVTLPTSRYIGSAPTFSNGETWEISIKDDVVIAQKVGA